ncbi:uncharacterized protein LOC106669480, partial [Cimex lectularius]|uniref:Dehydrogenase n=1 Tax=Cimex lectularius TaxID=79782 RepID=A0A8I6TKV7_CIMLE
KEGIISLASRHQVNLPQAVRYNPVGQSNYSKTLFCLNMDRWVGKVAVVTGVSSGIGECTARLLVKKGMKVAGLARRFDRVKKLEDSLNGSKGELKAFECDVSDAKQVHSVFEWIEENWGPVGVLVNNAAVFKSDLLTNLTSTDNLKQMFDVNVIGVFSCTREALISMKKYSNEGCIINISSVSGHHILYYPYIGGYTATKHAITCMTEYLRFELGLETKIIRITSISPGLVETEMLAQFSGEVVPENIPCLKGEDIANCILFVLECPGNVNITELTVQATGETLAENKRNLFCLNMDRWVGKVAVVTGVSSGIGECTARLLVKKGMKVAGLARRFDRVKKLEDSLKGSKGELKAFQCDVSDEKQVHSVFGWIEENWGPVGVLVNNAAALKIELLTNLTSTDNLKQMFDINVIGVFSCTREALTSMKKHNNEGCIININSVAGHHFLHYPKIGGYAGTKHALTSMTEHLRYEIGLETTKIRITSISPGLVKTEMSAQFGGDIPENIPSLKGEDIANCVSFVLECPGNVNITELTVQATGETLAENKE